MSAGKRGADEPLATTSSSSGSSDEDSPRRPVVVKLNLEPRLGKDVTFAAASSTGATAATAAGKVLLSKGGGGLLVTPRIGLAAQGQRSEVRRPKLKKKRSEDGELQETKLQAVTPRSRPHREPLPMRMRALPQSFWQQPNRSQIPPATLYPVLPPLVSREGEDMSDFGTAAFPSETGAAAEEDRDLAKDKTARGDGAGAAAAAALSKTMPAFSQQWQHRHAERSITVTNTDLLSKLFEVIEKDGKKPNQHNVHVRKSRARKSPMVATARETNFLSGHDPFMIDSIADKLFPQLSLENSKSYASYTGNARLQLLTLKDGDRIVTLPSITIDQNYPQMLSELVTHI